MSHLYPRFAIALLLVSGAACGSKGGSATDANEAANHDAALDATEDTAGPTTLPLYDGHSHMIPSWPSSTLPDLLDEHGVLAMVVLGPANIAELQGQRPDEFVGFTFIEDVESANLNQLEAALAAGARGVGEVSARHFAAGPTPATEHAADHPTLMEIYEMAGDYGVPVNVHHDYSTTFGGELDTAVGSHPDTTFIWAHSGDTIPDNLRPYLEAHPNLLLDLSCRNDLEPFTTRPFELADQRLNEADGAIQERWRDLLEEHPDRFLFGSDIGPAGRLEIYGEILAYYRGIFAQLTPPTARMIAYENAQALFSTQ